MKKLLLSILALCAALNARATYQTTVLADTPIAYIRLNETSGTTAADSSGNSHTGTYNGGYVLNQASPVTGGAGVLFNGTSGYVGLGNPSALQLTGSVSVEAIIKITTLPITPTYNPGPPSSNAVNYTIVSKGYDGTNQSYTLDVRNNNGGGTAAGQYITFSSYNGTATYAQYDISSWTSGQVHHVVGVYDVSTQHYYLYIDGTLGATSSGTTSAMQTSTEPVLIGALSITGAPARFDAGFVTEVAIYGTALSSTRVSAHYAAISGGALTAGTLSNTVLGTTTATNLATSATGGTLPYTQQWYRSTTSGFTPGGGNLISGATSLTLNDTGLSPSTTYYYKMIYTDGASATVTSSQLAITTNATLPTPTVTSAIPSDGSNISLTFNTSVSGVAAADYFATVDGIALGLTTVSGSGTAWKLEYPLRWFKTGSTVTLSYTGTGTVNGSSVAMATFSNASVTNGSIIKDPQIQYVGRKFGVFLHFNMSTFVTGQFNEWETGTENPNSFNPTAINIDNWVAAAKAMGASYMVLTVKHHGGFCLWPSAYTTHTIASSVPWYAANGNMDIVQQFTTKCRAAGMGVGLYFSIADRNYVTANGLTNITTFVDNQLTELLTHYGKIDLIWTDGWGWGGPDNNMSYTTPVYATVYNTIKSLQPNCILAENGHFHTLTNTDIDIWEVPAEGGPPSTERITAEAADTIRTDGLWFGMPLPTSTKSPSTILANLGTYNSERAAFLFNCPPDNTGAIPAILTKTMAQVGQSILRPAGVNNSQTGQSGGTRGVSY